MSIFISVAALGASIWSILQTQSTANAQAHEHAIQAALTEAQTVQFVEGLTKDSAGHPQIDADIENFNKLPIVYDEILWSNKNGVQYTSLGSCEHLYFTAPTTSYADPSQFVTGAILYYRTPDGNFWARRLNGLPFRRKTFPVFAFKDSWARPITNCRPD